MPFSANAARRRSERARHDRQTCRRAPMVRSGDLEATRSASSKSGPKGPRGRCPRSLAGKINEGHRIAGAPAFFQPPLATFRHASYGGRAGALAKAGRGGEREPRSTMGVRRRVAAPDLLRAIEEVNERSCVRFTARVRGGLTQRSIGAHRHPPGGSPCRAEWALEPARSRSDKNATGGAQYGDVLAVSWEGKRRP